MNPDENPRANPDQEQVAELSQPIINPPSEAAKEVAAGNREHGNDDDGPMTTPEQIEQDKGKGGT